MQKLTMLEGKADSGSAIARTGYLRRGILALMTLALTGVGVAGFSQNVSFSGTQVPLERVFQSVREQTGYVFMYTEDVIHTAQPVTINVKDAPLDKFLADVFKPQPLKYAVKGKSIFVSPKPRNAPVQPDKPVASPPRQITGMIADPEGRPLPGATVAVAGKNRSAMTNSEGVFTLEVNPGDILVITFVGFEKKELNVNESLLSGKVVHIPLTRATSLLDDVHIIAYGLTTRRLTTGSIAKLSGDDIRKQPVENPLLALSGRLPGVQISQTSGLAGAPVGVIIRGKSSIGAGTNPLYVIDGVPFGQSLNGVTYASGVSAQTLGGLTNATSGSSPFVTINPADIESIEVLKDADATAIYGSRGANGVVLITTRKAKAGKTSVDVNYYAGGGRPTHLAKMLNTQQYVAMRREAFQNDSIAPTTTTATDLLVWDTTRYTNWNKILFGNQARTMDGQVRLSGGNQQTQMSIAMGYHRETPVYYGNMSDGRGNLHANMVHHSVDNKFTVSFNAGYSVDQNNLPTVDLMGLINTIPNAPYPLDAKGNLVWIDKGVTFSNPLQYIYKQFLGKTQNMLGDMNLRYAVAKGLQLKLDAGYNMLRADQISTNPIKSQSPYSTSLISSASFFSKDAENWIIEPQAQYDHKWGKAGVQVLVGSSWQQQTSQDNTINASGYTNDDLLLTPGPAASKSVTANYSKYRYAALFGRVSLNWDGKYLLNLSARRDGSSRFGPGKQFGNFGAVGAGWIFSQESFMKGLRFVSFGKLRASMGVTGNDQIGDYQYIPSWVSTTSAVAYQGTTGLYPRSLYNPNFAWERNRKWEAGLELSFFKERIFLSADYYLNKTDNQLTGIVLPTQTGFSSLNANLGAVLQNTGWELAVSTTNVQQGKFSWKSAFNITIPRNKLVAYPGFASSPYANTWSIGLPITISKSIPLLGVDPKTGIYQLAGMSIPQNLTAAPNVGQLEYGGLQNTFTLSNWTLDVFIQFVKQLGKTSFNFASPGARSNQPVEVLARWQHSGQITDVQRFTTTGTAATTYSYYANYSTGRFTDASYARLKNVSLSYLFDRRLARAIRADNIRVFVQGQNLLTFTRYKVGDPETLGYAIMPPMRMLTAGAQVSF